MQAPSTSFYDDSRSPERAAAATASMPAATEDQSLPAMAEAASAAGNPQANTEKPQIGFCGLGAMGFGMATHLLKQGYPVKGFDVYHESRERFEKAGGIPTTSLAHSAEGSLFYICMVATAQQAQVALFDPKDSIVRALPENATLLLCSTVPASYAKSVEEQLSKRRRDSPIYFVDCPVSGGAVRAANGTLSIMAGASVSSLTQAGLLLEELTEEKKLYLVPGGIGQGSNMKMAHQVLAAVQILATSEAIGFAARLGLDAKETQDAIVGQSPGMDKAWSWMFENRSPRILAQDYFPGVSALTIILKDTGIITASARELGFPATLCTVAEQMYLLGLAQGYGGQDDAGMVRMYYPDAVTKVKEKMSVDEKARAYLLMHDMLGAIHMCAAAEALALAATLRLPIPQFVELVCNAAGSSTMFKIWSQKLNKKANVYNPSAVLLLEEGPTADLKHILSGLIAAVSAGQVAKCPLPLATAAMGMLLDALRLAVEQNL